MTHTHRTTFDDTADDYDDDTLGESSQTSCQKTWAHLSLRYLTKDVLPKLDHYRNLHSIMGTKPDASFRPTLDDLHNPDSNRDSSEVAPLTNGVDLETPIEDVTSSPKFGWIKGVFVRCLLNIWGVMLFLRLSWVTGQAGILGGIGIVFGANVVTTITALSMSAISTNGQIRGGGTYYMISRSLGPEFGGAIGIIFSFANAVASSMYIVGFCESLLSLLAAHGVKILDGGLNDIRIIGSVTLIALFLICIMGGMAWESRAQLALLFILLLAMVDFIAGVFIGPVNPEEISKGFLGLNSSLLNQNLFPDFRPFEGSPQTLFTVFAVFFPACTGILAGANISGDLRNPSTAIPKGSLLSIMVTSFSYILFVVMVGGCVARDATGDVSSVEEGNFLNCSSILNDTGCQYGLMNSFQVMELVSIFGPVIYAGCFAATLSSALASLVSAPKVFQALCKDKLFPFIHVFGRGYGKSEEPYLAYVLTLVIAFIFIAIANLNSIASIISNFFLAAYALVNYSCFHASYQKSPGWRPTFKYYNMWLSLLGAVLCVGVMVLIEWWTAILTTVILLSLYLLVAYRKLDVNWGSSVQSQFYREALNSMFSLDRVEEHVKTFRPQVLLLSGSPSERPPLVHFANNITKNMALLITAECSTKINQPYVERNLKRTKASKWLANEKVKAFYVFVEGPTLEAGARHLMCTAGLGKLRPNTVMLGFKSDWSTCPGSSLRDYFQIIHSAFDLHFSVCILRIPGRMNYADMEEVFVDAQEEKNSSSSCLHEMESGSGSFRDIDETPDNSDDNVSCGEQSKNFENKCPNNFAPSPHLLTTQPQCIDAPDARLTSVSRKSSCTSEMLGSPSRSLLNLKPRARPDSRCSEFRWSKDGQPVPSEIILDMQRFNSKQPKGTIDVWWLFDDGGLTLLLPYILTTRSLWEDCKLRVYCLCGIRGDLEKEHRKMTELIRKFRIDISDVIMINDIHKRPSEESMRSFECLIEKFKRNEKTEDDDDSDLFISDEELKTQQDKTRRNVRLKELLLEHSSKASLIAMTLPMPTKGAVSAPLYLAWLETLTKDLPPFLLVRGNQTNVLTFYS